MLTRTRTILTMLFTAIAVTACADPEETASRGPESRPEPAARAMAGPEMASPDTTTLALRQHLDAEGYRENWRLWPGTERMYTGTEPHGMLLTTYANDVAHQALAAGSTADLPAGSIIVKENYMPDGTFDAATVMYRVDGYNPEHGDWLYAKYDSRGLADDFGRPAMCQACHQQAPEGYVFTPLPR